MEHFFVYLYPLVAIVSIVAYIPQVKTLLFATRRPQNISLSSWVMWCFSSFLAFGYSLTNVQDLMLSLTSGLNMGFVFLTTGLIAYNRFIRFGLLPGDAELLAPIPVKVRARR